MWKLTTITGLVLAIFLSSGASRAEMNPDGMSMAFEYSEDQIAAETLTCGEFIKLPEELRVRLSAWYAGDYLYRKKLEPYLDYDEIYNLATHLWRDCPANKAEPVRAFVGRDVSGKSGENISRQKCDPSAATYDEVSAFITGYIMVKENFQGYYDALTPRLNNGAKFFCEKTPSSSVLEVVTKAFRSAVGKD